MERSAGNALRWLRDDRQVAFAVVTMAFSSFATLGFPVLIPTIRGELHLSPAAVGSIASATYVAALLTAVPSGRMADRFGAEPMIGISQLAIGAGLLIVAISNGAIGFFSGVALAGAGYGIVTPATNLVAMNTSAVRSRGPIMSVKQAGVTVGGILAGAILPGVAALAGWRTAILLPVGCSAFVAGWVLLRRRTGTARERVMPAPPATRRGVAGGAGPATGMRSAAALGCYGFLMSGTQFVIFSYLALYLVDRHGQSTTLAGSELSLAFIGASVGRLVWGVVSDRVFAARASALQLAATGTCVAIALIPVLVGGSVTVPFLLLLGFCSVGWNGVFQAVVADSTSYANLGRASGLGLGAIYLGAVLVPPAFGLVLHLTTSWADSWLLAAVCPAATILVFRVAGRSRAVTLQQEPA